MVNELKKQLANESVSITENGALGHKTTSNPIVDFNFALPSLRTMNEDELYNRFIQSYLFDKKHFVKWMFYVRDCREGAGERLSFYRMYAKFLESYPEVAKPLLREVVNFGRWDDLMKIAMMVGDTNNTKNEIFGIFSQQLTSDLSNMQNGKPVSLLAKWLPSVNASGKARKMARELTKYLKINFAAYRKTLSKLRAHIDVIERKTSSNNWGDIDYSKVPSGANLRYSNAFDNHDKERHNQYLDSLKNNVSGVKMNAKVLAPYQIVHKYSPYHMVNDTFETMWKNLKDIETHGNSMVILDTSGSMEYSKTTMSNVLPCDIARSLAIFFAERCTGEFKDKCILFSANPALIDFSSCETLHDKLDYVTSMNECSNTNIEKTFKLLLNTAEKYNIPQEDMPDDLIIISDMEFDPQIHKYDGTLFESISQEWSAAGYKLPKLIFWNVASRSNTVPMTENENGVLLISGCSQNAYKMVLSGEMDPEKALYSVLDSDRYKVLDKYL